MGFGAWNRWPRVVRPVSSPSTVAGTTSSPCRSTTPCTGLTNSALREPQRMRRAMGSAAMAWSITPGSRAAVAVPRSMPRKTSHAPFSVTSRSRSVTSTPQLRANASAACVGEPEASNALLTGGPRRSTLRSGVASAHPDTSTARRRGVAKPRATSVRDTGRVQSFDEPIGECRRQGRERARRQLLGLQLEE